MSTRDFVMARLASARYRSNEATDNIAGCLELFIEAPEEDIDGEGRMEAIEIAETELRAAAESLQAAREAMAQLTGDELAESELEDDEPEDDEEETDEPEAA